MADLYNKPFEAASGFLRRVFKGFPAYYAKPDLEQYFDSFEHVAKTHSKLVIGDADGMVVFKPDNGWNAGKTIFNLSIGLTPNLVLNFNKFKASFVESDLVFTEQLSFVGSSLVQIEQPTGPTVMQKNITNILLTASKRLVTYSDDPTVGGISGPTMTNYLESSDVEEYYDFSLATVKGIDIPETIAGKEVLCVVAQATFYFDGFWQPMIIQNFRTNTLDLSTTGNGSFPVLNKVLGAFGKIDWLIKVTDALNSLALRIDGSNMALTDLYVNKGATGVFKIITRQDYATTTIAGIARIANTTEVLDPSNNTNVITPLGLYTALGASRKILNIGVWDMDSLDSVAFTHGLGADWVKAVPSSCSIYTDLVDNVYNLFTSEGSKFYIDETYVYLERPTGGIFESPTFSSALLTNRGYVILDIVGVTVDAPIIPPTVDAGTDYTIEIPTTSGTFTQRVAGTVTNLPIGATITNSQWAVVTGPTNPIITAVPGSPYEADVQFSVAGNYVLRFSVTVSNGVDSAIGTDAMNVTATAEVVNIPTTQIKWVDGTVGYKVYTGSTSYNIGLLAIFPNTVIGPIQEFEFSERHTIDANGDTLPGYSSWSTAGIVNSAGSAGFSANFNVQRSYGTQQFRVRIKDANNVWSAYSNVLECTTTYTVSTGVLKSGINMPVSFYTGPINNNPFSNVDAIGEVNLGMKGVLVNPSFDMTIRSEDYWVEYDPSNVQALPPPELNYEYKFLVALPLNVYDTSTPTGRAIFRLAVISALKGININGFTDLISGLVYPPGSYIISVSGTANETNMPDGFINKGLLLSVQRGSSTPNKTLNTQTAPSLASRVRVLVSLSNFSS